MEVPKYNFVVPGTLIIIQNALKISAFKVLKLDITWKMKKSKNFSLSLSVNTLITRGMFCGARYTHNGPVCSKNVTLQSIEVGHYLEDEE